MPTPPLTLVIANKNYSSWSLRPWLAMTELGIAFAERLVKFDSEDWARNIDRLSPTRLVPVLWEGEPGAGFATYDSIAILERLHELRPEVGIWPADPLCRARARSLAADFHASCQALRTAMPMNIRSRHLGRGMNPEVARDIDRLCDQWTRTRAEFGAGGPFLFGGFSAADAFFTPVASRFVTYGVRIEGAAKAYQEALLNTQSMRAWTEAALKETEFVAMDEPYA
ncbi:MAG: glutathione S-transferase [Gammaproteobacteria bacterium]|nr:glutathione S-transferase [Gammaproteobacteria bacterium]